MKNEEYELVSLSWESPSEYSTSRRTYPASHYRGIRGGLLRIMNYKQTLTTLLLAMLSLMLTSGQALPWPNPCNAQPDGEGRCHRLT